MSNKPWNITFIIFYPLRLYNQKRNKLLKSGTFERDTERFVLFKETISKPWDFKLLNITFDVVRP